MASNYHHSTGAMLGPASDCQRRFTSKKQLRRLLFFSLPFRTRGWSYLFLSQSINFCFQFSVQDSVVLLQFNYLQVTLISIWTLNHCAGFMDNLHGVTMFSDNNFLLTGQPNEKSRLLVITYLRLRVGDNFPQ